MHSFFNTMAKGFTIKTDTPESNRRYSVSESGTTGWELIESNLTKEDAMKYYNALLNDGVSPDRIKITRIQ